LQAHEFLRFGLELPSVLWANQLNRSSLDLIQKARLNNLIRYSVSRSPVYERMVQSYKNGRNSDGSLLHVTKSELMARFNEWVLDKDVQIAQVKQFLAKPSCIANLYLNRYYLWESSGSSGIPGTFVQESRAMAIYDALEWGRLSLSDFMRLRINPMAMNKRIAFIGVLDGHFASAVSFMRCKMPPVNSNNPMRAFSISLPIDQLVQHLNAFKPDIIATYPSMAVELVSQAVLGRLRITPSDLLLGGETLGHESRLAIQNAFTCQIHNQYGASEFLPMAWECAFEHLHANTDWLILEPVDSNYRLVKDGEVPFTTLITNLANYVQPVYRYDIGDQIIFNPEPCKCGSSFPRIEVIGRKDDVIRILDKKGGYVTLLPLTLSTIIEQSGIYDFQIHHHSPNKLTIKLVKKQSNSSSQIQKCISQFKNYLGSMGLAHVHLEIEMVSNLNGGRSGKAKRIFHEEKNGKINSTS
jgi:phenylacetate-CoA ligase